MTPRKLFIIIVIILLLTASIVGALWYRSRQVATQEGRTAPTFREFIGLGSSNRNGGGANGDLSSEFTDPTAGSGTDSTTNGGNFGDGMNIGDGGQVTVSSFTSDTISPIGGGFGAGTQGSGSGSGGGLGTPPILTTSGTGGGIITDTMAGCSEADMNIAFTDAERVELERLRQRFDRIASRLHNDSDANQELDNYDEYVSTVKKANELNTWCEQKTPNLANPAYKTRVATPFWRGAADVLYYFAPQVDQYGFDFGPSYPVWKMLYQTMLQRALRLNLW